MLLPPPTLLLQLLVQLHVLSVYAPKLCAKLTPSCRF
jgi:hypothetical protein